MLRSVRIIAFGVAVTIGICIAGEPAGAITAELAKKCRALALKAHPYKLVGVKGPGTAAAQRDYFSKCVARNGDMPAESTGGSSGDNNATPAPPPE